MFPQIFLLVLLGTSINCQDFNKNDEHSETNPVSENSESTEYSQEPNANGRFLGHLLGFDRGPTQTVHHHHHNENQQKPIVIAPSVPVVHPQPIPVVHPQPVVPIVHPQPVVPIVHPQPVVPIVGHPIPIIPKPIIPYQQPQFAYYPGYYPYQYTGGYPSIYSGFGKK